MSEYVLSHGLHGERQRLQLMSELLDGMEHLHIQRLGLRRGWRCLEIGCGNGSVARWLAGQVGPEGRVVATDIDTSYLSGLGGDNLKVRRLNVLTDAVEENSYDFVLARAVLHHLSDPQLALRRMAAALKPGGAMLSIEPDVLPISVAQPDKVRAFWDGWLQWSIEAGIHYFIGRDVPGWLDGLGMEGVTAEGHTAIFNGGSPWATYIVETMQELRPRLLESGHVTEAMLAALKERYGDPHYWTSAINFVAASGRKPQ